MYTLSVMFKGLKSYGGVHNVHFIKLKSPILSRTNTITPLYLLDNALLFLRAEQLQQTSGFS